MCARGGLPVAAPPLAHARLGALELLALAAEALDLQLHDVTGPQVRLRLRLAHGHATAVPVTMTSPGYRVMNWLRYRTTSPTGKIWSAVLPSCLSSPLTHSFTSRPCGSGTSSAVTSHGPSGVKVSQFLPLSQVPPRSIWNSRSETSLTSRYPPTCARPSSADPR